MSSYGLVLILNTETGLDYADIRHQVKQTCLQRSWSEHLTVILCFVRHITSIPFAVVERLLDEIYTTALSATNPESFGDQIDVLCDGISPWPATLFRVWLRSTGYANQVETALYEATMRKLTSLYQETFETMDLKEGEYASALREDTQGRTSSDDAAHLQSYNSVALGGTFDHLHAGHKILLTMSAWLTKSTLYIGVADGILLQRKKYIQHIESIEKRIQCVIDFVQKVAQGIDLSVVPILEPLGPTGTIHDIEALVISEETASGAAYVNEQRIQRGLPTMDVVVIKVASIVSADHHSEETASRIESKLSSSYIRSRLCETD